MTNPTALPKEVTELLQTFEDSLESCPYLICNHCGGTNCDSEIHPEIDGCPTEMWCNTCDSTDVSYFRDLNLQLLREVRIALTQAHQDAEHQRLKNVFETKLNEATQAFHTEFPPRLLAGGGKVGRVVSQRETKLKLEMAIYQDILEQLAPSEQKE